ncbi:MAG: nuclear transport factor 2 family protein [Chloroflexota bacterium]|nr:nuclear transport factor 2 family protein [Chloroflexota bacterium]
MPEQPSAALIRRLFQAFAERDFATTQSIIAEDAVWYFPGTRGALAGGHRGREATFRFLASVMTLRGGTFHLDIEDITASENNVVVLFTGHGQRDGKTLDNPTALRVRIRDGQAVEFREFVWDLAHVEDFRA